MYNYEECLEFIRKLGVRLFPYQRKIIKSFCKGETIFTPRGCGRSFCANLFGRYVSSVLEKQDYETEKDNYISFDEVSEYPLYSEKMINNIFSSDDEKLMKEYYLEDYFILNKTIGSLPKIQTTENIEKIEKELSKLLKIF